MKKKLRFEALYVRGVESHGLLRIRLDSYTGVKRCEIFIVLLPLTMHHEIFGYICFFMYLCFRRMIFACELCVCACVCLC